MAVSLDTVSHDSNPNVAALERPTAAMPPEKHLDMPTQSLQHKTAIVMPVYNEQTDRTFAALEAIYESVHATGLGDSFDYFILSDTTNPDAWVAEERAFLALKERLGPGGARFFYRHRPKNHHRKAGNIADFVSRWGGHY